MVCGFEEILKNTYRLENNSICLRRFKKEDYKDVFEFGSDELTLKYLVWEGLKNIQDAKDAIENYYSKNDGVFAIELNENKKCIGCIDIRIEKDHEKASFGYVLNKNYWNKGYMTEALETIINFCFLKLDLNRIESTHYLGNDGSGKVMQKCNMQFEGVGLKEVKVKGVFHDVAHYGIIKENWMKINTK